MENKVIGIKVNVLKYSSVVNEFLNAFPEYTSAYNEHIEFNGELLPHVFFGETISEDLPILLEKHRDTTGKLKNMFAFMERMAESDRYVQEVLTVTILARLGDNAKILEAAAVYMGDKTKIASVKIEKFLGRK